MEKFKPKGLVYLPTSSYPEMDEWTMEPKEFLYYKELKDRLKNFSDYKKLRNYLRAGFFRNFFVKYPRANYMHKKMLYLSENIHKKASIKKDKEIFQDLYRAQCNCGYWHGLFGGFYYGNIRSAIYENLIKAEKKLDEKFEKNNLVAQKADFDFDGLSEMVIKNKHLITSFSDYGGTLLELSYKDKNFNLQNTITRKEESYHNKIKDKKTKTRKGKIIKKQEIIYDRYERLSLVDHLLDKKITLDNFNKQQKFKTLSGEIYKSDVEKNEKLVLLNYKYDKKDLEFTKKVKIGLNTGLNVAYNFQNDEILKKYNFATEFNLFFESLRYVKFHTEKGETDLKRKRKFIKIKSLKIADYFKKIYLKFSFNEADVFIMPVYSFANSQDGVEKVFQEASILFIKKDKGKVFDLGLKISKKENLL